MNPHGKIAVGLFSLAQSMMMVNSEGSGTQDQASSSSLQFLDILPRYGGQDEIPEEFDDSDALMNYGMGVGFFVALCLLPVLLSFVVCPFWCICRSC